MLTIAAIVAQARREAGDEADHVGFVFLLARELCTEAILRELHRRGLLSRDELERNLDHRRRTAAVVARAPQRHGLDGPARPRRPPRARP
ncbi:MAG TPA: hypothetical protein VGF25_19725 [Thermoleophilaceae bacterium]|jgi:hypothetical protein